MKCEHCGYETHPGDQICIHCGEVLSVNHTIVPTIDLPSEKNDKLEQKKINQFTLLCIGGVIIIVLLVFVIVLLLLKR